ncbi:hypothetical protein niasHS_007265 [Heterodera schachtii]|uniref:Dehydrogenase/reductase SDR family member 1 n=1 Tax=Heterodera schachtii TaxID=97005 RepID=A0ABD2JJT8_HETSC
MASAVRALEGKIAVVTGASRGIGRGIALQLGQAGATVYVTGRAPAASYSLIEKGLPSLEQTAKEIKSRGGEAHPVYCDHANSDDVRRLFKRVEEEQNGRLHILVNNAYSGVPSLIENAGKKFWECEPEFWDDINEVGLRNVYFCSTLAARLMVPHEDGLIVHISSAGGLQYLFSVPYGVGKAAVDRMASDMGLELKSRGVAVVSLWPGFVQTEITTMGEKAEQFASAARMSMDAFNAALKGAETPEFVGKAIVGLATDRKRMAKSGKIHLTGDLAREYGFTDQNGVVPTNLRSVRSALQFFGWLRLAKFVPAFIKSPKVFLHFASYKF